MAWEGVTIVTAQLGLNSGLCSTPALGLRAPIWPSSVQVCQHTRWECLLRATHHLKTRLSQSPITATQMSLMPTASLKWNQMGKRTKKAFLRSAA